ncbi:unnamed protein product [Schistocephalus solidus]|uniref:Ovule protein n=1 Tax=Schistocephalus solidus TaxID=70667 RepID=A0A183S8M3_SCHSO|nr:unnamed protein product [Schistocephalus solidus]
MLLSPTLTVSQPSSMAPGSWFLPSGHTPGNRHHRQAKQAHYSLPSYFSSPHSLALLSSSLSLSPLIYTYFFPSPSLLTIPSLPEVE